MIRRISIGISLSILSSMFGALGTIFQKKSTNTCKYQGIGIIFHPPWMLGTFLIVIGSCIQLLAFFYAPFVIVGTIMTTRIIWVTALSVVMLNEELTRHQLYAIGLLFNGCLMVVSAFYVTEYSTGKNHFGMIMSYRHMLYMSTLMVVTIAVTRYTKFISSNIRNAAGAGIFAALCQLERTLFATTMQPVNVIDAFTWWSSVCITVYLILLTSSFQCFYLSKSFRQSSTVFTMSVVDTTLILLNILNSGAFLSELTHYIWTNWSLTVTGSFIMCASIRVLSKTECCSHFDDGMISTHEYTTSSDVHTSLVGIPHFSGIPLTTN